MELYRYFFASVFALMLVSGPAAAQGKPITLEGDVKLEKTIVEQDGASRVELVEPEVIVPGDRLVFGTDYRNNGSEAVANFIVTNPLPGAVRLAPDADPDLVVSIDGGARWGTLASMTVNEEDGSVRAAQHADVTHIRWTLALVEPGESGRLEYPAIIR